MLRCQGFLFHDRKERDKKVQKICEEAGIPIIKLWTSYGVNAEYISKVLNETIESEKPKRVAHYMKDKAGKVESNAVKQDVKKEEVQKKHCYVATCVYGSVEGF